jgi:5-methylcytosine-specific restriction endonuclease McrA
MAMSVEETRARNREYKTAYRAANPDKERAYKVAYYAANPEKIREYNTAYRAANPEKVRELQASYRAENPEKVRAWKATWRESHRDKVREINSVWQKANPVKACEKFHRRRARKRNAPGEHYTAAQWKGLLLEHQGKCIDCGTTERITVGHMVPLARGGSNAIDNIRPQCRSCNSKQGTKVHPSVTR